MNEGFELFSTWWPPEEWKILSDTFKKFTNIHGMHDIDAVSEISQQLYLDMDSWGDWYEKRRKQKEERQLEIASQLKGETGNT
jgi:hypothetical protein